MTDQRFPYPSIEWTKVTVPARTNVGSRERYRAVVRFPNGTVLTRDCLTATHAEEWCRGKVRRWSLYGHEASSSTG